MVLLPPLAAAGLPEPLLRMYERLNAPIGSAHSAGSKPQAARAIGTKDASDPVWVALDGAYAALREGDLDAAIAGFETAVQLNPKRIDIRKDLAYTYLRTGENELARRQFEAVTGLDPVDWHAQLELAFLDYDTGTTALKAAARAIFVRTAREGDDVSRETARRAVAFIDAETELLLKPFQEAVRLNPLDVFSWFRVGIYREERNEYLLAYEAYERANTISASPILGLGSGRVQFALGRRAEAIRVLQEVARTTENLYVSEEARELIAVIEAGNR